MEQVQETGGQTSEPSNSKKTVTHFEQKNIDYKTMPETNECPS